MGNLILERIVLEVVQNEITNNLYTRRYDNILSNRGKLTMKQTYKVSFSFIDARAKSMYVTAESENAAINIAKYKLVDHDLLDVLDEKSIDRFIEKLVSRGYFKAEKIQKPENTYPYYVTLYYLYPIYEPAEGGCYYNGIGVDKSYGFQTYRQARQFLAKRYKECFTSDCQVEGWDCMGNHKFFGVLDENGYIGNGYFWQLERKQGVSRSGRKMYC